MSATPPLPRYGRVHLTFDDGPDATWTERCLEVLSAAGARATFFMIGAQARRWPGLVRQIASEGHAIGNHTATHAHPWTLGEATARAEVRDGAAAIADIIGMPSTLFRPPHGARRRCMLEEAAAQGESLVMWDRSAIDWGWWGRADGIARRLQRARNGDVILMHDGANKHNRPDQLLQVLPAFLSNQINS